MSARIYVETSDVWELFQRCKDDLLKHERKIAENQEYGVAIYLTDDGHGYPNIIASLDDEEVYSEMCISESDCKVTTQKFYDEYLSERILDRYFGEDDDAANEEWVSHLEEEEEIDDRESELDAAVYDFLTVVLDGILVEEMVDGADEILEDIKEHFLEYIARKWDLPVRRPMYLEDNDGVFYEEYPYECMEFDDEDNPIYK